MKIYQPTIKDFEERYGIARSNVNNRLSGLKQKGYNLDAQKVEGKNVYTPDQVELMDQLNDHLKAGGTIASFPGTHAGAELNSVLRDTPQMSHRPQDKISDLATAPASALGIAVLLDGLAGRVADLVSSRTPEHPDPLAHLRALQEIADHGWQLPSSELCPLVGLKSLRGETFTRYGFLFTRVGREGKESLWAVERKK